jgi:hypothetical protein
VCSGKTSESSSYDYDIDRLAGTCQRPWNLDGRRPAKHSINLEKPGGYSELIDGHKCDSWAMLAEKPHQMWSVLACCCIIVHHEDIELRNVADGGSRGDAYSPELQ